MVWEDGTAWKWRIPSKDALNVKKDASKLKDLEYLKQQEIPGPFTTATDVKAFIESDTAEKLKQDWHYIEVCYAKATWLTMNTQTVDSQSNFFPTERRLRKK